MTSVGDAPQNASAVISHGVRRTPITLFMRLQSSPLINRNDLLTTLYDSRDYLRKEGNGTLAAGDDPFNSTKGVGVMGSNCELTIGSGPQPAPQLTYEDLNDVVQGLLDYLLYPFKPSVASVNFAIYHASEGFIGTGTVTTKPKGASSGDSSTGSAATA